MEIEQVTAKPIEGLNVPKEDRSGDLDPKGETVPFTTYYRRREADGDITITRADDQALLAANAKPAVVKPLPQTTAGE